MRLFLVLLLAISTVSTAQVGASESEPVVPGEYLVRSLGSRRGALAATSEIDRSWALLVDHRAGTPNMVAGQLSEELGLEVVPNRLVPLAQVDEPRFTEQWPLDNDGQTGGTPGADIDAPGAWLRTTGDPSVVVAIIDSGIDRGHPDLGEQLWSNPGEVDGNGLDDDNNGLVDDVYGWDFLGGDADPSDSIGHGTAVAGIVAAAVNGTGIAGIAPGVRFMPLKACTSTCPMSAIVASVDYAVAHDVDIINLSLGGYGASFEPLADALAAADEAGILVVTAAGNTASDNDVSPFLPAGFELDNIVAVSATDHTDQAASFSNFGALTVDLAAPGVDVLSTVIDGWALNSGTSFSAPHVAGTAALMLSIDPLRSPVAVRRILIDSTKAIPQLTGSSVSGGRLNAAEAVRMSGGPTASIRFGSESGTAPSSVELDGSGSYDPTGSPIEFSWTINGEPVGNQARVEIAIQDHLPHVAQLRVVDADLLSDTTSVIIDLNGAPTVNLSPSILIDVVPAKAPFHATVSDPDDEPVTVEWTVDGEKAGEGPDVVATFGSRGAFELAAHADDGTTIVTKTALVLIGDAFVDTASSVFHTDVTWASATGLTVGCGPGRFCPDRTITRGESAAFLNRFFDLPAGPNTFGDDAGSVFEEDIDALAFAGITRGCRLDGFCPDRTISREEWAAMLARALELPPAGSARFVDLEGSLFASEVEALAAANITFGCNPPTNDRFCPKGPLTRGEVVAMLRRSADARPAR